MKYASLFIILFNLCTYCLQADPQIFLNKYCTDCHNENKQKGKLRLDQWNQPSAKLIDLVIDQIENQEMPPEDELQPNISELSKFISEIEHQARPATQTEPFQGRRLNREEYFNTVLDILEIPKTTFNPIQYFPQDPAKSQSTKHREDLITSEFFLEALIQNIDDCVEKAFNFKPKPSPNIWKELPSEQIYFEKSRSLKRGEFIHLYNKGQYSYLTKLKEGVPEDGFYNIRVKASSLYRNNPYQEFLKLDSTTPARLGVCVNSLKFGPNLHLAQNGMTHLAEFDIKNQKEKEIQLRVWLNKGDVPTIHYSNGTLDWRTSGFRIIESRGVNYKNEHIIGEQYKGERTINLFPKIISEETWPKIRVSEMSIEGPFYDKWPSKSHQKWFGKNNKLNHQQAWKAIHKLGHLVFQRELTEFELQNLKTVFDSSIENEGSIEQATKEVFKAILCMPNFLYLFIDTDLSSQKNLNQRISCLLWSTPNNSVDANASSREQVTQFLKHPKSWNFVSGFLNYWLGLDTLGHMAPDKKLFPSYYIDNLQNAMRRETELFFAYCLYNNLSIEYFIDSDFLYVNRDLCRHYNIDHQVLHRALDNKNIPTQFLKLSKEGTSSNQFFRIKNFDRRRGGLLGQASILTLTANGTDTNPILRGVWFLESILGQKPKLPSGDVPELEPDIRGSKSIREQLEKHRESPQCASCHQKIDPPGFVLESFDPIGRWRNIYPTRHVLKIDSVGSLFKQEFNDITDFKNILLKKKDILAKTIIKHLMSYALGRDLKVYDDAHIQDILKKVRQQGYGLQTIVLEIVDSPLFKQ